MKSRRTRLWLGLSGMAVAGTMALSACGSGSSGDGPSQSGTASGDAGEVTVAFRTPNWILPISAPGYTQGENAIFTNALYRPLFNYDLNTDADYHIDHVKSLGETPEFSDDGKTMTLQLRDANWSDGEPVTTRDIEFWWNLVNANKEDWASYREGSFPDNVTDFTVVDDKTFTITTDQAYSPGWFVGNQLNKIWAMPQHAWDKTSADGEIGDYDETPEGAQEVFNFLTEESKDISTYGTNPLWQTVSGPWKIGSYVANGQVDLVPNDDYWGEDKAQVDKVVLRPFTGDDAEFNVLRAGEIDYGYIPAANVSQSDYISEKGYTVDPWYGWSITYIPLNFAHPTSGPIFAQDYIRQALQMLIDQPTLSESVWSGIAAPTCGPVPMPQDKLGTTEGCAYQFDPEGAQKLLEDNGWKIIPDGASVCENPGTGAGQCGEGIEKGAELKFKLVSQSGFEATSKMMAELKSQMSRVGIDLEIQEVPDSVSVTQKCEGDEACTWDMSFFGSQGSWYFPVYASGERLFETDAPVNLGQYSNAEADELIRATEFSSDEKALETYNEFLAADLPVLWAPNPVYQLSAYRSNLEGVAPQDPMNLMYPEDWHWAD